MYKVSLRQLKQTSNIYIIHRRKYKETYAFKTFPLSFQVEKVLFGQKTIKKFVLRQANSSTVAKTYKHTPRKPVTIFCCKQTSNIYIIHRRKYKEKIQKNKETYAFKTFPLSFQVENVLFGQKTIKKVVLKQANCSTVAKTYKHTPRKPVTIFRQTSLNFAKFQ